MRYDGEGTTQNAREADRGEQGSRERDRGYVGQFSRNSMGRDRHSNPRYPVHPFWKLQPVQTSLKLHTRLVSTPSLFLSLHLSPFSPSLRLSLPSYISFLLSTSRFPCLPFLTPFLSLSISYLCLCFSLSHFVSPFVFLRLSDIARLSFVVRLSLSAFLDSNPRMVLRDFNSCDNYLDFSCTALTAQSFHCNYLLVSTAPA